MVNAFQGSCLLSDVRAKKTFGYINEFDLMYTFYKDDAKAAILQNNTYNLCCACADRRNNMEDMESEVRTMENVYPVPLLDAHIYYGWKECKKLGIPYTPPDPTKYNNAG